MTSGGVCVRVERGGGLNLRSFRYVPALCFHMASTRSAFMCYLEFTLEVTFMKQVLHSNSISDLLSNPHAPLTHITRVLTVCFAFINEYPFRAG